MWAGPYYVYPPLSTQNFAETFSQKAAIPQYFFTHERFLLYAWYQDHQHTHTHTHTRTHTNCSPTIIPHVLEEMIRPSFPARSIPHNPIHYLYDIIITSLANTYMHSACAHTLSSITSLSTAALKKCMMLSPTHICKMYIHVHVGVCFCCVVCLPPYLHLGSSLISDSRKSRALIYGSPL